LQSDDEHCKMEYNQISSIFKMRLHNPYYI